MAYVLLCLGDALGGMTDEGKYLKDFDVDAHQGLGSIHFGTLEEAMRFDNRYAATKTVQTVSKVRPKRDDGKPNRLLSAWHWEVVLDV